MNSGRTIFAQLMDLLPLAEFHRCVDRYRGDYKVQSFSCLDQFLCLAFAQLTYRESLRDIRTCLRAHQSQLYHMGFRGGISRNNRQRQSATRLAHLRRFCAGAHCPGSRFLPARTVRGGTGADGLRFRFHHRRSLGWFFPGRSSSPAQSAVKLHTLLDLRGSIPTAVYVTSGRVNDVRLLDQLVLEAGAFCHPRSRLCRLSAPLPDHPSSGFLRHPRRAQYALPALQPAVGRSFYGAAFRSNHSSHRTQEFASLSRTPARAFTTSTPRKTCA